VSVAFVLPSFAGGGAERVMLALLVGLDRARFTPSLIAFDAHGPLRALVPADIALHDLKRGRLRGALLPLLWRLRVLEPAVIVSSLGYVNIALLALRPCLKGRPRLFLREANPPAISIAAAPWPLLMRLSYRHLYRRADAILCNAAPTARALIEEIGVPKTRVHRLNNPIDVAALRAQAVRPIRVPGAGPRFIAIGRLTRQKGFDRLIEIFAEMPPDAHLTILGEGEARAALEALIRAKGLAERIALPGFVSAPAAALAGADAFLLPSRWEGQSNAALEALALGVPVIATPEAGGVAELGLEAPPGALTLAAAGAPFLVALRRVQPAPPAAPRPSLLPAAYHPEQIAARFATLLAQTG
jgi:glycosyltransferase involved in cell wall biosynthesis